MITITPALIATLAGLVVIASCGVSVAFWFAVRPSEDKVRKIVNESLHTIFEDIREMRGDIKKLLERR